MKAFLLLEKNWFNLYRKPFCSLSLIVKNTVLAGFLFLEISETEFFFEFWKITWHKGEKCCSFFRNSNPPGYAFAKPSKLGVGEWGEHILLSPAPPPIIYKKISKASMGLVQPSCRWVYSAPNGPARFLPREINQCFIWTLPL